MDPLYSVKTRLWGRLMNWFSVIQYNAMQHNALQKRIIYEYRLSFDLARGGGAEEEAVGWARGSPMVYRIYDRPWLDSLQRAVISM